MTYAVALLFPHLREVDLERADLIIAGQEVLVVQRHEQLSEV